MAKRKQNLEFTVNVDIITKTNKQLEDYVDKIKVIKDTVGNRLSASFLDDTITKIKQSEKELTNFTKVINNTKLTDKERFAGIQGAVDSYRELSSLMKNLDKNWMKQAIKNNDELLDQLEDLKKRRKELSAVKGKVTKAKNATSAAETELTDLGYTSGTTKNDLSSINSEIKNIQKTINSNKEQGIFDNKDLEAELEKTKKIKENIEIIIKQRPKLNDYSKEISNLSATEGRAGISDPERASKRLDTDIEKYEGLTELPDIIDKTETELNALSNDFITTAVTGDAMGDTLSQSFKEVKEEAQQTEEATQTLKQVLSQFGIGFSAYQIVNYFKELAVDAFEFYKSLDQALNEIYVVSSLTSGAVDNLKDEFISMAKDTGMAIDDVTRSAVLFYQQGLNTDEVMEMTEVTSQFAKVAGIDATDAADKLTAAVNGYCLSASDAALVADKFNEVAAASAADINELSTAFSKAAAQANQAGVSMDNYLAYIATMEEATREAPENIGTSLKTIFSRMQQVKESGSTEDGETDVNQVETALKSVGVALRDSQNELRDLEEVLDELGGKWQGLDRNTQAYLGTIIAGTRQQSRFITLMQNWDRVLELSEDSANSAGQQALMHAKSMESIESKLQQLNVAWQEFISNLSNSETFKTAISLLTNLLNRVNSGSKPFTLLATSIALLSKNALKLSGPLSKVATKFKDLFKNLKGLQPTNLKNAKNFLTMQKATSKYNDAINESKSKIKDYIKQNMVLEKQQDDMLKGHNEAGQEIIKNSQEYQALTAKIQSNSQAIDNETKAIEKNKKARNSENPDYEKNKAAYDSLGQSMTSVMAISAMASAVLPGDLGKAASAVSGVALAFKGITTIVPIVVAAVKAGAAGIKAAIASTGIGAIILAIIELIMGVIEAVKALVDIFGNQDKKIAESVERMGDALEKYSNAFNKTKGAKKLLEDYEKLSSKIYLTATEQEKLNETAQELADSLGLEAIEDEYGNLSVSITDVQDKIAAMEQEAEDARKELIETEHEEIEKYDHNGNVDNFYKKYLKANKADIRNAMSSIETGLDTTELKTSAKNVENIMTNLKNNVIENSAEMSEAFGGLGIKWSLTEDVESMMNAFNNADISSDQWNSLYQTFDTLQDSIDSISYDKALEVVEGAISSWGKAAGLTTEQLNLMTDAIMDSLYGSSNLHKTMAGYDDIINKYSGKTFKNQKASYEKQLADLEKESTTFWNPFKQDDAEAEYESVEKKLKLLKKEEEAYRNIEFIDEQINKGLTYGYDIHGNQVNLLEKRNKLEEEYGIASAKELQNAKEMKEILGQMSDNAAATFNAAGLFDENGENIMKQWNSSGTLKEILDTYKASGDTEGTKALTTALVDIINNTNDADLRKAAEEKLNNVFKNIQISGTMSWNDLSGELNSITESMSKMNGVMEEFRENGAISLDTFADLCDVLDGLDMATIFDTGMMDQYLGALDNLRLGFDETSGAITANAESMQTLEDIQELATQAKLAQTAASLEADKASLQSQIFAVEAEIEANKALIEWLKTQGDVEISLDTIKQQGQAAYSQTMQQAVTLTGQQYQDMTQASSTWAEAAITNAAQVGEAIKKAMTGELGTGNLNAYLNSLVKDMKWKDTGSANQLELLQNDKGMVNAKAAIASLEGYNEKGYNTISALEAKMKSINSMQGLLNDMSTKGLGRLGLGKEDAAEIDKYIGKLQEIYNILRQIEGIEARISNLEDYSDIAHGQAKAAYLAEQVDLTQQLVAKNEELLAAQKYMENTEQAAIKGSPVGDVFDFDEFGNIIIDYEKYTALQDESIDGQETLKELADELYDEYQNLHDTTQEYFSDLVKSLEDAIDAQQEMVDTYVDLETELANAVKDIYQNMLDEKLDAIDTEIEALDKLAEAYDKANQAASDSKELSNMQTSMKRAMMDTSGASNTKVLDYRDQIASKIESMGQDAYTQRMDDIKESLEEQKEMLQEQFDEFFEDWEQLYTMIENHILPNQDAVIDVLKTTSDYLEAPEAARAQLIDGWKTEYAVAMQALQNGGSIMDVVNSISALKDSVTGIDTLLKDKSFATEVGNTISEALTSYYNQGGGSGSSGGGSGSGSGWGGSTKSGGYSSGGSSSHANTVTAPTLGDPSTIDTWATKAKGHLSNIWTKLGEIFGAVGNFFTTTLPNWWLEHVHNPVIGFFTQDIPNFFTVTIPGFFSGIGETISTWWSENISPLFTLEYWKEKIGNVIYNVSYGLTEIGLDIKDWWDAKIAKFFTAEYWEEKWNSICEFFSNGWDGIVSFFTEAIPQWWDENIAPVFTAEFWQEKWDGVNTAFSNGWNSIVEFFTSTIPQWWDEHVAKFFTLEYWREKISNIGTAIKNWWSGIKEWFHTTIGGWWDNNIAKFFTKEYWVNKFISIKEGLVSGVKNAFNAVIDVFNSVIDKIGGFFNWLGKGISKVTEWLTGKSASGANDAKANHISKFETGGLADFTGPAWLDGTKSAPEAVLNASQTEAFMRFVKHLDKLDADGSALGNASVNIESISFEVASMSSKEDGEKAFDAFVNRFKEIGSQTGLSFNKAKI